MKKVLYKSLLAVFVTLLVVGTIPVDSPVKASGPYLQPATYNQETLPVGTHRVTPYATSQILGSTSCSSILKASISSVPSTMTNLKTKIVCEWRVGQGTDGIPYLITGENLFSARVTNTRVSIDYSGRSCAWDPIISLGGKNMSLDEGPYLIKDPLNTNYGENTVVWTYNLRVGGFLGWGTRTVTVFRYLRQIEGSLQEYYVLDSDPGGNIRIYSSYDQDSGFIGTQPVSAWGSDNSPIKVSETAYGKEILYSDIKGVKYPITIDPTSSFTSSSSDGYESTPWATSWAPIRTRASAAYVYTTSTTLEFGDYYYPPSNYYLSERAFLYFDTSSIPVGSTVTSASLNLYYYNGTACTIYVSGGMPTYPHNPLIASDFYYGAYSGDYGHLTTGGGFLGYQTIYFTSAGLSSIQSAVQTGSSPKFILWGSGSYLNVSPVGYQNIDAYSSEMGVGYQPTLSVTYSLPVTVPVISTIGSSSITSSSARLDGYLVDSGNGNCPVWFRFGTTSGYGQTTSQQSGYISGQSFYDFATGLSAGTVYHYTAEAQTSAGLANTDDKTFLTKPDNPTGFSVTPGNTNNSLSWTLGTGSTSTLVRYKTTGYPLNTSDGTQAYFGSNSSYVHTSLTNGITYYYTIWGYASSGGLTQYSQYYSTGAGSPVYSGPPSVVTYAATGTDALTTATLNGYLDSLQGYGSVDCWFQYYTGAGSWTDNSTPPDTLTATGQFSEGISGLTANTSYHCRAVASSTGGTTYGSDLPFTTGAISAPTMVTQSPTAVTLTSAQLKGLVFSDGEETCTVWFEYGESPSYGYSSTAAGGQHTGDLPWMNLPGLTPGTTYHYRVAGQNSGGTSYGSDVSFTTSLPGAPSCSTGYAVSVGSTSATLQGFVVSDGGVSCSIRFLYGLNTSYGSSTGWQTGFVTGQNFNAIVSGLNISTSYNFMAQITSSGGTSNGSNGTFTTQFGAPDTFQAIASSPTSIMLSWTPTGDQTGVWYSTGSFPADRFSGTEVYFGSASGTSVGSLTAGTTYFFRAWSWLDGGFWSPSYSEDVVTTPGQPNVISVDVPGIGVNLTEPSEYFQAPNGSGFSDWPGYTLVEDAATGSGIPSGSLWLIIATVFSSVGGVLAWRVTGSLPFVIVTIGVVIAVSAIAHLVSLWILFAFIVMGGAMAMVLKNQSG